MNYTKKELNVILSLSDKDFYGYLNEVLRETKREMNRAGVKQ